MPSFWQSSLIGSNTLSRRLFRSSLVSVNVELRKIRIVFCPSLGSSFRLAALKQNIFIFFITYHLYKNSGLLCCKRSLTVILHHNFESFLFIRSDGRLLRDTWVTITSYIYIYLCLEHTQDKWINLSKGYFYILICIMCKLWKIMETNVADSRKSLHF